MIHSRIYLVC